MSFFAFLLNTHLFLSIYTLFVLWKDDRLSNGTTLDEIALLHPSTATRNRIMLTMLALCVLPILNLVTIYRLVLAELATIRDGWVISQKRVIRNKGGFSVSD